MAVYIAISPLQWRWGNTVDDAIGKSISTYNAGELKNTKLPVKLYLLNREMNEISKKNWVLHEDTTYLGTYRAFSRSGSWQWTKYI
jgi:hypothetical protein